MKFSKLSQLFMVAAVGLLAATTLSGCLITTIDYVFVACSTGSGASNDGQIQIFAADSESGALRTEAPTVSSGGVMPVSLAVSADYANLYVANAGSNTVAHFAIGIYGALTAKDTITTSGTPAYLAVNAAGTYLYVISCTSTAGYPALMCTPGSAALTEYPLSSGAMGGTPTFQQKLSLPSYPDDVLVPTGITALANNAAVYVTAYDTSNHGGTLTPGWVFGYTVNSGGTLSATASSPYPAGVKPTAIAADPSSRFIYITDYVNDQLVGYSIMGGNTLSLLYSSPFKTGNEPAALAIDPRALFVYVANALDSTVSPYAITLGNGNLTVAVSTTGVASDATDAEPVAIVVDAALGRFVYTANYLGNSISGFLLDTISGALSPTQATPYPTGANPTALVSVPHGNYATESVTP